MLLEARSIRNHQSFKKVFSDSLFRGYGNIERMEVARREQLKPSLRLSDAGLQVIEKNWLVRRGSFNAFN